MRACGRCRAGHQSHRRFCAYSYVSAGARTFGAHSGHQAHTACGRKLQFISTRARNRSKDAQDDHVQTAYRGARGYA